MCRALPLSLNAFMVWSYAGWGGVWLPFTTGPTNIRLVLTDLVRAATDASLFTFNLYIMSIKIMVTDFLVHDKN